MNVQMDNSGMMLLKHVEIVWQIVKNVMTQLLATLVMMDFGTTQQHLQLVMLVK